MTNKTTSDSARTGADRRSYSAATILEERHMVSILLFLRDNEGCTKSDLYGAVSYNVRMPDKLDRLEAAGLIVQDRIQGAKAVSPHLTSRGDDVVRELRRIETVLEEAAGGAGE